MNPSQGPSRAPAFGRPMPAWFPAPIIGQPRASMLTPPPLPVEPPPTTDESEYEEISDHLRPNVSGRTNGKRCSLCDSAAVVTCGMCENQNFCGYCNDIYHRHPKRLHHARRLIGGGGGRPPLPPKAIQAHHNPAQFEIPITSSLPPIPPPRRNKRLPFGFGMRSANSSPTLTKKVFDPMGTLKRFVGNMAQRPLPPTPKAGPPLPPKPIDFGRPSTPVMRTQQMESFDRRNSSPAPMHTADFRQYPHPMQNARQLQSISVANLQTMQRPPSRNSNNGFFEYGAEQNFAPRQRAQSVSMQRFPSSSQDASHFATLQRAKRGGKGAEIPPPPLPPRSNPSQPNLGFQSSHSAFNINQMGAFPSPHQFGENLWNYPGDAGEWGMMGYPGTMNRTPSNQSMGGMAPQSIPWGWGPLGFGPPMSQQEMEFMAGRRGFEPHWQAPPRPPSVSQSQPVTPQSSFRRKVRPSMEIQQGQERFHHNQQQLNRNQRPMTPRSLSRMNASPLHFQDLEEEENSPTDFSKTSSDACSWTCEHCTFINPKSSKICSICCKTPSVSIAKSSMERKGSTSSTNDNEENIPVVQSKLSISRGEKQQATINLTESVESMRKPANQSDKKFQKKKQRAVEIAELEDDLEQEEEEKEKGQRHQIKINTKKCGKVDGSRKAGGMNGSNEDVYGSVPLSQAITISPKIDIRRRSKGVVVGGARSAPNTEPSLPGVNEFPAITSKVDPAPGKGMKSIGCGSSSSSSTSSPSMKKSIKATSCSKPNVTSSKTEVSKKQECGNDSNQSGVNSKSGETTSSSSIESSIAVDAPPVKKSQGKASRGTSPPPQTISTQTYEELPVSKIGQHSTSKASMVSLQSFQSDEFSPNKQIEMSQKALRYARKAQHHHHQAKLKRSMSTHLSSSSEPWMDDDGRPLYRSLSRHSIFSDARSLPLSGPSSRDASPPRVGRHFEDSFEEFGPPSWERLRTPENYFASLEDVVRRRTESTYSHDDELGRLLKEAEEYNFTPKDVQVAMKMCGERNPIKWLKENWSGMVESVQTLATKYGREKGDNNQIGTISSVEAKETLRSNRGNVWAAVTECIEQRRKKFMELQSRGNFMREDILTALTANHGNLDAAYVELSKAQLKPFLMRIWGAPSGIHSEPFLPPNVQPQKGAEKLITATKNKQQAGNDLVDLPEPRLELLVSNASKLSQEIVNAIEELKQRQSNVAESSSQNDATAVDLTESQSSPLITIQGKSDEDESFADAISASDSDQFHPASPMPKVEIPIIQTQENSEKKSNESNQHPYDEAGQAELIKLSSASLRQNSLSQNSTDSRTMSNQSHETAKLENKSIISGTEEPVKGTNDMVPGADKQSNVKQEFPASNNSSEIEQLLTTLTTTFAEIGQFSTEVRSQIASEIQQQLTAVVNAAKSGTNNERPNPTGNTDVEGQIYEPVELLESVNSNVTKKMEKYKRLAAKKGVKSNRHKSPDVHHSPINGEESHPGSSLNELSLPTSTSIQLIVKNDQNSAFLNNNAHIEIVDNILENEINHDDVGSIEQNREEEERRDEGEYYSGPDNDNSDSELKEIKEGEEGDFSDTSSVSSSEEESIDEMDQNEIFSRSQPSDESNDGEYEEVNVKRSSVIENNKTGNNEPRSPNENMQSSQTAKSESINDTLYTELHEIGTEQEENRDREIEENEKVKAKSDLVKKLMEMNFCEEDSVLAANECSSLYTALSFLQQECDLCAGKFTALKMVSMLRCAHICCHSCAKEYFTGVVRDKSIVDATCPFCSEPVNLTEDVTEGATDYFNHLDILLKSILEPRYHEMFGRKLRDWALAKTPNFKWCSKCSSGFITEPLQTRLICPDCNAVTCAICLEEWDKFNHDHRESKVKVCDSYSKPIVDYLNENSVECPRCHFRFALARGGCMHLTCTQCRHEFCSGCSATFRLGSKCEAKLPICEKLGLHAHHPRNCLFYLRDKEPEILCKLLEDNAIPYLKENSESTSDATNPVSNINVKRSCQVSIQKDTKEGLKDYSCGKDAPEGYATVCKAHYVEYLWNIVWKNQLDPISILSNDDLEVIIRRANKKHPGRPYSLSDEEFRNRLLKVIQEEVPL